MNKLCFLILLVLPHFIYSQQYEIQENDSIDVIDYGEYMGGGIKRLLKKHQQIHFRHQGIQGFCVQIYSGNSKEEAEKIKYQCIKKFPNITSVEYVRVSPNWKVRAGKCRTKLEAKKLQNKIKKKYPGAYITEIIVPIGEFD